MKGYPEPQRQKPTIAQAAKQSQIKFGQPGSFVHGKAVLRIFPGVCTAEYEQEEPPGTRIDLH